MRTIATLATLLAVMGLPVDQHFPGTGNVQTVPVGPWPTALVLDRRTGHAFVLNSGNNTVSVIDVRSGALLRTMAVGTFPGAVVQTGYTRAIAVDERRGRVFVGTYGQDGAGGITTLAAASGALVQVTRVPVAPAGILVDEQSRRLFVTSNAVATANLVSVLDTASGRLLRTLTFGQNTGVAAVVPRTGRVVAVSQGQMSLLDARGGDVLRTIAAPALEGQPGPVAVDDTAGRVVVASRSGAAGVVGRITTLDARSGAVVASVAAPFPQEMTVDERLNRVYATVSADGVTGTVLVLNAATGRLIGATAVGRSPGQVVADARTGRAFVINGGDGTVTMLDARSGRVLGTVRVRPAPTTGLFDIEGTLSHLLLIDEARGRVLVGNPSPYRFPHQPCPRSCPGPLPVLTGPGSVSVLDAASGRLVHTVTVGRAPLALALDAARGRAVVLNADAASPGLGHSTISLFAVSP